MNTGTRGTKRNCHSCRGKYYDMGKLDPVCPMCGTAYVPEVALKSRGGSPIPAAAPKKVTSVILPVDNDRLPPIIDDDDDAPIAFKDETEANDDQIDDIDLLDVA